MKKSKKHRSYILGGTIQKTARPAKPGERNQKGLKGRKRKEGFNIRITGEPRTKKNSGRIIIRKAGRRMLLPSKQYQYYNAGFSKQCREAGVDKLALDGRYNIACLYYMKTRRKVDLCNLIEGTMDSLVDAGVLADDNSHIVAGHDGSRVLYDKENPHVDIMITPTNEPDPFV